MPSCALFRFEAHGSRPAATLNGVIPTMQNFTLGVGAATGGIALLYLGYAWNVPETSPIHRSRMALT
jgi:hypothetical protein